ncbi:hypothetical protein CTEN210_02318 [Chaetoceros tenuissimus]|uniref:Uncharacterized protein n=1 Tax=Chaetoceros tenuissimus TaxID=426638 RepID=A0AAD3H0Z0_9STRA|nr:hypothetical protein CTEN210_02318 [Chaetoceros tenuissimus]
MPQKLQLQANPADVRQNNFDPGKGNALQAAVASIFGLTLQDVPNFIEMPNGYETEIKDFCSQGGVLADKIPFTIDMYTRKEQHIGALCLLRGKSPRGDFGHVIVARFTSSGFDFVHDPHPENSMLDIGENFGWCMFFSDF